MAKNGNGKARWRRSERSSSFNAAVKLLPYKSLYMNVESFTVAKDILNTYSYIEDNVHGADRAPAYHLIPIDVTRYRCPVAPILHHRSTLPCSSSIYLFTVAYLRRHYFHHFRLFHFYLACPILRNDLIQNIREEIQVL